MTDEALTAMAVVQTILFKYICGFPLVLINDEYPFFLSSKCFPNYMLFLIVVNIIFQIIMIKLISKLIKKLR